MHLLGMGQLVVSGGKCNYIVITMAVRVMMILMVMVFVLMVMFMAMMLMILMLIVDVHHQHQMRLAERKVFYYHGKATQLKILTGSGEESRY